MTFTLIDTAHLEKALDASSHRQFVISNNIANAHTPGFLATAVTFDNHLDDAMEARPSRTSRLIQDPLTEPETVSGPVDVISEMVNLSKNQILYAAYTNQISTDLSNLQWIVENSGR